MAVRGVGECNWFEAVPEHTLPRKIESQLQQVCSDKLLQAATTIVFELNLKEVTEEVQYNFLEFIELVYEVTVELQRQRDGQTSFIIRETPRTTDVGVRVGVWLCKMPEPKNITITHH